MSSGSDFVDDWLEFLERVQGAGPEPGASEEEIAITERRLGTTLPPGYRSFLTTTNGFGPIGSFVRRLRPVDEIRWLRDEDPELIQIWTEATGDDALAATLAVSDEYDGARLFTEDAAVPEQFDLVIAENLERRCQVVWRLGGEIGVRFLDGSVPLGRG